MINDGLRYSRLPGIIKLIEVLLPSGPEEGETSLNLKEHE